MHLTILSIENGLQIGNDYSVELQDFSRKNAIGTYNESHISKN